MRSSQLDSVKFQYDYDPFGMMMSGRNWGNEDYRFGFSGEENVNEIYGDDIAVDFGARLFDARLGRWLSVDPYFKNYPQISPYSYALNNPVLFVDPDGNTIFDCDGNEVKLIFDTETGELSDIQGTNNEDLKRVILDTWNESKTGKATINELNANDVTVQIIVSNKVAIWPSSESNIAVVGLTVANYLSSELTGTWKFRSEDGSVYDSRIYLFNSAIDPTDADESQIDVFDTKNGSYYLLEDGSKAKAKVIKKYKNDSVKHDKRHKNDTHAPTEKALDVLMKNSPDDYGIFILRVVPLKNLNAAFGYLSTLIHENVHFQVNVGKMENDKEGGSEYTPRVREVESYNESGRAGLND